MALALPRPARIDRVVLMEDILHGERVRAYAVDTRADGGSWTSVCEGTSIGHKRIQEFAPVRTDAVRLRVTCAANVPEIRRLAVFEATE